MDFKEIGINTRNWVDSTQNRDYWKTLENAVLNLRVPISHVVSELIIEVTIKLISKYHTCKNKIQIYAPSWHYT